MESGLGYGCKTKRYLWTCIGAQCGIQRTYRYINSAEKKSSNLENIIENLKIDNLLKQAMTK